MRDHTKLRAFELADHLAISAYQATVGFPRAELFGLAARSTETAKVLNGLLHSLRHQ
jgi:hypothetical protein